VRRPAIGSARLPELEVHFLEDEALGWPEGYRSCGTFTTNRTAEAVEELGEAAGTYRVRALPDGQPKLWQKNPDGSVEMLD
jgi:hypothetical protein